jgi:hypothetical protein
LNEGKFYGEDVREGKGGRGGDVFIMFVGGLDENVGKIWGRVVYTHTNDIKVSRIGLF